MLSHLCPQELCGSQPVSRTPTSQTGNGENRVFAVVVFLCCFIKSETGLLVLSASMRAGPSGPGQA